MREAELEAPLPSVARTVLLVYVRWWYSPEPVSPEPPWGLVLSSEGNCH